MAKRYDYKGVRDRFGGNQTEDGNTSHQDTTEVAGRQEEVEKDSTGAGIVLSGSGKGIRKLDNDTLNMYSKA
jgi:hypothetical protein